MFILAIALGIFMGAAVTWAVYESVRFRRGATPLWRLLFTIALAVLTVAPCWLFSWLAWAEETHKVILTEGRAILDVSKASEQLMAVIVFGLVGIAIVAVLLGEWRRRLEC